MPHPTRRLSSRDAALVELQRLHAAIQASRARRGLLPAGDLPSPEASAARELTRRLQASDATAAGDLVERPAGKRRGWWLAIAAVVLVAGVWAVMTFGQRRPIVTAAGPPTKPVPPPPAAPVTPAPAAVADGAPPTAFPTAPTVAAAPQHPVRVTLDTIRPVWMRVWIDGRRVMERELAAGEHLSFDGEQKVVVRVGDAGGVRASLNGVDFGAMGLNGWPLTVSYSADGVAPLTPIRPGRPLD